MVSNAEESVGKSFTVNYIMANLFISNNRCFVIEVNALVPKKMYPCAIALVWIKLDLHWDLFEEVATRTFSTLEFPGWSFIN